MTSIWYLLVLYQDIMGNLEEAGWRKQKPKKVSFLQILIFIIWIKIGKGNNRIGCEGHIQTGGCGQEWKHIKNCNIKYSSTSRYSNHDYCL